MSKGSIFSAMDTSQSTKQEVAAASSQPKINCVLFDEFDFIRTDESETSSPPLKKDATNRTMLLDIPSVAVSVHTCFVCGQEGIGKKVGKKCRLGLFRTTGIYVHPENRICPENLEPVKRRLLNADGLVLFLAQFRYEETFFTKEQFEELVKFLEKSFRYSDACKGRMSFRDGHRFAVQDFLTMLEGGVTKDQFMCLHENNFSLHEKGC